MPITIINLILAAVILFMGLWAYSSKKSSLALYTGIGFGMFALSHLFTLIGLADSLDVLLTLIRIIGYLMVIFALYLLIKNR